MDDKDSYVGDIQEAYQAKEVIEAWIAFSQPEASEPEELETECDVQLDDGLTEETDVEACQQTISDQHGEPAGELQTRHIEEPCAAGPPSADCITHVSHSEVPQPPPSVSTNVDVDSVSIAPSETASGEPVSVCVCGDAESMSTGDVSSAKPTSEYVTGASPSEVSLDVADTWSVSGTTVVTDTSCDGDALSEVAASDAVSVQSSAEPSSSLVS